MSKFIKIRTSKDNSEVYPSRIINTKYIYEVLPKGDGTSIITYGGYDGEYFYYEVVRPQYCDLVILLGA